MKRKMLFITVCLLVAGVILLPLLLITKNAVIEIVTISVCVTLYHFAMRLTVGAIVNGIMKNKADHQNAWFREKSFEHKLFKLIGVRKWEKYLPTYDPDSFDTEKRTVKELIGATCQAETVHLLIMLLSLLPILLIPFLGGALAFILTSVLSMSFDFLFVILQRYHRPRLVRVMTRFERLKRSKMQEKSSTDDQF